MTAQKAHVGYACGGAIPAGERYRRLRGGDARINVKAHEACYQKRCMGKNTTGGPRRRLRAASDRKRQLQLVIGDRLHAGGRWRRYGAAKLLVAARRPLPCPFRPGARSRAPAPATGTGARTTTASTTGAARTLTRWPPIDHGDGAADLLCVGQTNAGGLSPTDQATAFVPFTDDNGPCRRHGGVQWSCGNARRDWTCGTTG